ncbi:histidine phosphatase family protein [Ferrimonas senticii]|uniref:histidine phosphatase family protein n=1 Tax=Ferrimonas senticii TaxID=394566 RepID=UPI000415E5E2|nr:histidine phosphatase family protein [Ferrimonas senticii]
MSRQTVITLLRHGQPYHSQLLLGRADPALTELGFSQCQQALVGQRFDLLVSSPRQRCQQFAEVYAAKQQLLVHTEPRFAELDFGDWDGMPLTELWQGQHGDFASYWHNPFTNTPPNGESTLALQQRVVAALTELAEHSAERVLVICHGGVLRVVMAWLFGQTDGNAHLSRLELGYASQLQLSLFRDDDGTLWPQLLALLPTPSGGRDD